MSSMIAKLKNSKSSKELITAYLFLLPFMLFYLVFTFYPLLQGFIISFYDWAILDEKTFIGIDNYKELFGESSFWNSLRNTIGYVVLSTPIFVAGSFFMAI